MIHFFSAILLIVVIYSIVIMFILLSKKADEYFKKRPSHIVEDYYRISNHIRKAKVYSDIKKIEKEIDMFEYKHVNELKFHELVDKLLKKISTRRTEILWDIAYN